MSAAWSIGGMTSDDIEKYRKLQTGHGGDVAVGIITPPGSESESAIIRYLPSGRRDSSFAGADFLPQRYFAALCAVAIQSDGRILIGSENSANAVLIGLHPGGNLDTRFGVGGMATLTNIDPDIEPASAPVTAMAIQPDGKILAAAGSDLFRLLGK